MPFAARRIPILVTKWIEYLPSKFHSSKIKILILNKIENV